MASCAADVDGTAVPLTAHGHFVVMTGAQIPALCDSARKGTNMRHSTTLRAALLLSVIAVAPARADVSLLAIGTLDGTTDLSGLTNTLENGVPANILGGLGSGIAFAGGDTFLAVPDRGPNAVPFDSNIDNTASYINRFQTLKLNLTANPGGPLPSPLRQRLQRPPCSTARRRSPTELAPASASAQGRPPRTPRTNSISPAGPTISGPEGLL